jgi:nickel-dependent lactate racemase
MELALPEKSLLGVYEPLDLPDRRAGEEVVAEALARPIGARPLRELVRGRQRVVLLVDDITRPTPASRILPPILKELKQGGMPPEACTVLIAGGTHRTMTPEELEQKLGPEVAVSVEVRCHSAQTAELVTLDDPEGQIPIHVNRLAVEADLLVGVGQILPHAISGFSGGGKIVAPGICGRETIRAVHWSMHLTSTAQLYWFRDNPVREAIDRVARRARLEFLVNVITDKQGDIAAAVAGDPVAAHREGCNLTPRYRGVVLPQQADVVVADALPFDVDWWQAIKALPAAAHVCRPGGSIIVIADCPEGFAPEYQEPVRYGYPPADKVKRMVKEGVLDGIVGAHMLIGSAAAEENRRITLVSAGLSDKEVMGMGFTRRELVQQTLEECIRDLGTKARVAVLPAAAQIIPRIS